MRLYTLFDKVAIEGSPLVECKNDAVAMRMARDQLRRSGSPQDYELLCVGEYYPSPCHVEAYDTPLVIDISLSKEVDNESI